MKKKYKILIVDDEEDVLEVTSYHFLEHGFAVEATTNPRQALTILQQGDIDLILSDVRMPEYNGVMLLEDLKRSGFAHIPLIFMSAYADISIDEALQQGAYAYYHKPLDFDSVIFDIYELLAATKDQPTLTNLPINTEKEN